MKSYVNADQLESKRAKLQTVLDSAKTQGERNFLGQFATPISLAEDVLAHAKRLCDLRVPIKFLDPAIGTGSFYSALLKVFPEEQIHSARGFEIDPHYGFPAKDLWKDTGLDLEIGDFTYREPRELCNLLICNPPYVRHHHIANETKTSLSAKALRVCGVRFSGLAGLYCYFLALSHAWLERDALAGWLIPSEFMDVNYGQAVKRYLLKDVTLLQIHRFDPNDLQFADALVSSSVVWIRNSPPPSGHEVLFTFGGCLEKPTYSKRVPSHVLDKETKWTRFPVSEPRANTGVPILADFFRIKRGLATGDNGYFILSPDEIRARDLPMQCFRPILPSPRYLSNDQIEGDRDGNPLVDRKLFLLDPPFDCLEIQTKFPTLWLYLEEGRTSGLDQRYLCRHRNPWYAQENRPPPPLVCTYLGRGDTKSGRPFRFILNRSKATVANVYLAMYPMPFLTQALDADPNLIVRLWETLNDIAPRRLLSEGRVYGGGLHKLEPRELANVEIPELADLLDRKSLHQHQQLLFTK